MHRFSKFKQLLPATAVASTSLLYAFKFSKANMIGSSVNKLEDNEVTGPIKTERWQEVYPRKVNVKTEAILEAIPFYNDDRSTYVLLGRKFVDSRDKKLGVENHFIILGPPPHPLRVSGLVEENGLVAIDAAQIYPFKNRSGYTTNYVLDFGTNKPAIKPGGDIAEVKWVNISHITSDWKDRYMVDCSLGPRVELGEGYGPMLDDALAQRAEKKKAKANLLSGLLEQRLMNLTN